MNYSPQAQAFAMRCLTDAQVYGIIRGFWLARNDTEIAKRTGTSAAVVAGIIHQYQVIRS